MTRPMPTCGRCGRTYSYRTWLIRSPETADMCGPCETETLAVAAYLGVIGMFEAIHGPRLEVVDDPAELRLLRELERAMRDGKSNVQRRTTPILKKLNALRGRGT